MYDEANNVETSTDYKAMLDQACEVLDQYYNSDPPCSVYLNQYKCPYDRDDIECDYDNCWRNYFFKFGFSADYKIPII